MGGTGRITRAEGEQGRESLSYLGSCNRGVEEGNEMDDADMVQRLLSGEV